MLKVTDSHLLKQLDKPADWGFSEDYSKEHPTTKFYRNLKTGERKAVFQGLPKIRPDGVKICGNSPNETTVGWIPSQGGYISKPNIFDVSTKREEVKLEWNGKEVEWSPQLFLNGAEKPCNPNPDLIDDPTNPNYHQNVLEWDYGFCKRRLRVIEGAILERWVFETDPHGEVRIKHNQSGKLKLRFGEYQINNDEELVPALEFDGAIYPVTIGASLTVFSAVDGEVLHQEAALTWHTLVGKAGTGVSQAADQNYTLFQGEDVADQWVDLRRLIVVIDTSALGPSVISAATFTFFGQSKVDNLSATPDINIYSAAPANEASLASGDFNSLGTTAYCDTPITYANFNIGDPGTANDFILNATGLAAISKTANTVIGARNANYDVADELDPNNHDPNWVSDAFSAIRPWMTEKGAGYQPKLVITYTPVFSESASVIIGVAVSASRTDTFTRASSVIIGVVATAARSWGVTGAASVVIGVAVSASRILGLTRTASVAIGIVVSASRVWGRIRTASVVIGIVARADIGTRILRQVKTFVGKALSTHTGLRDTKTHSTKDT